MAFCKKVKEKGKGLCSALLGLSDKSFLIFPTKTVVARGPLDAPTPHFDGTLLKDRLFLLIVVVDLLL
ncbi:hypothetical protein V6N13_091662 [Hibiscus sabdariffa]